MKRDYAKKLAQPQKIHRHSYGVLYAKFYFRKCFIYLIYIPSQIFRECIEIHRE